MSFFKSKKKERLSLLIPLLLIVLGIFIGYRIFVSPNNNPKQWTVPDASGKGVKYVTEESLVNDIKETNKLIPLEIELSQSITIDDSWGTLGLFEKYKKLSYTADCSYAIDLSTLESSDLSLDTSKKQITLKIPKPTVYNVNINHDKTIYEEATTGLLRFGDLTLTSEEYGVIEREIKKSITDKMNDSELYDQACNNSESAMQGLLSNLLGDNITVTVAFIE